MQNKNLRINIISNVVKTIFSSIILFFIYRQLIETNEGSNNLFPTRYATIANKFRNSQQINEDLVNCPSTKQIADNALFAIKNFDGVDNFVNVVNV